jgi:hypothetical protein
MDKRNPTTDSVQPGISLRNGPVTEQNITMRDINGTMANGAVSTKRKIRESMTRPDYAESESSEDDQPLVCPLPLYLRVCKDLPD